MASCLGLYIENNLIKYAKVTKINNTTKIDSFGVKFYENMKEAIKQIVEETYSFKTPISINLSDESYNEFEVFSMLNERDIEGVVETEFESLCYDNGINKNLYEQRHILASLKDKGEKIKVIHISAPKTTIEQQKNTFKKYRMNNIFPMGITIPNLIEDKTEDNIVLKKCRNFLLGEILDNRIIDFQDRNIKD